MSQHFTEQDTERYYDEEDATYRRFWDSEGSLHWGYFDESTGDDFLTASAHLNDIMLAKSGIQAGSAVLDLGCGNGGTSMWLAAQRGCRVTGLDLSGVRIHNAADAAHKLEPIRSARLAFMKASAACLPFGDGTFSHIWSQATIYHVPDKEEVFSEAYRVLQPGGILICDDLTKPKADVSAQAQRYVYDRLLFDTPFSFESYQQGLRSHGFHVLEAQDLSPHLKKSYDKLGDMARAAAAEGDDGLLALSEAYRYMVAAVEDGDLGWALYLCQKAK